MSSRSEQISEIIHKKKEAKKKQYAKGLMPVEQLDNRTIGEGSTQPVETQEPIAPEVDGQLDSREQRLAKTRNQLKNFEIDEYLQDLVMNELIDAKFVPYFAKALHLLGISTVNRLRINALNGDNPQRLFAYKVKGAMQLHYKREFEKL